MRLVRALAPFAAALAPASSSARGHNYDQVHGPRYAGRFGQEGSLGRLRIVTFNLRYGREIDRAIELFRGEATLRRVDLVALQEMDAPGVERLARALGYDYVYYPAVFHPRGGRDFGNGILVRGRILSDHKLPLPHPSRTRRLQRVAVAADVEVAGLRLRAYSVHLETPAEIWPWQRREQLKAVLADAGSSGPAVIAGDFNGRGLLGRMAEQAGFRWLSRSAGSTVGPFAWDHVFARGLDAPARCGVVRDNRRASDHRPVWAVLSVRGPRASSGWPGSSAPRPDDEGRR